MPNQKVLFIFPPWVPSSSQAPYLAPHLLSTILRSKGFEVENYDLNLRFVKAQGTDLAFLEKLILHTRSLEPQTKSSQMLLNLALMAKEKAFQGIRPMQLENIRISQLIRSNHFTETKSIQDYKERGLETFPELTELFEKHLAELNLEGRVICISCAFGEQLPFALDCARFIRKNNPRAKILIGGAQISLLPQELLEELIRFKLFNVIFTGYAEDKIAQVVEHCPETFCTEVTVGSAATSKGLDELPFTQFDNMEEYDHLSLPVLVNKGCYWGKCTFCDYTLMGDLGGLRYLSRSVDIVFQEIKALRERYPDAHVSLISDAVPPKFYRELCERANSENFPLRTISYMINNKNLTEEFFIQASKAQISRIVFGTESFSDRILGLMKKQASRQDILDNLELVKKYDLTVTVNLIPNYPTTTFEEALDTVALVEHYKNVISSITHFRFYLSANTEMDQNPEYYNIEVDKRTPYTKDQSNGYHSKSFSLKKAMTKPQEDRIYKMLDQLRMECRKNYRSRDFHRKLKDFDLSRLIVSGNCYLQFIQGVYYVVSLYDEVSVVVPLSEVDAVKGMFETRTIPIEWLSHRPMQMIEDFYVASLFDFVKEESTYVTSA